MSCAVTRIFRPDWRTLPSSTVVTPSAAPILRTSSSFPLNANAEVREATRSASIFVSALMISSVIPSLKYSFSLSALMLRSGSTAIEACRVSVPAADRERAALSARGLDPVRASRSATRSAKARSRADWKRSSGSFSRQWATMSSSSAATARPAREISGGSSFKIAIMDSTSLSLRKARSPDNIS